LESTPERESLVTVEIKSAADGCELTLTHESSSMRQRATVTSMAGEARWTAHSAD
jgi:hypothetical protein